MYQEISATARDVLHRKMSESLERLTSATQTAQRAVNGSNASFQPGKLQSLAQEKLNLVENRTRASRRCHQSPTIILNIASHKANP